MLEAKEQERGVGRGRAMKGDGGHGEDQAQERPQRAGGNHQESSQMEHAQHRPTVMVCASDMEDNDGLPLSEALMRFTEKIDLKSRQFPNHIPPVIREVQIPPLDCTLHVLQMLQEIGKSGKTDIDWNLLMPIIATMIHLVRFFPRHAPHRFNFPQQECHNFYQRNGFVGPLPQTFIGRYFALLSLLESYSQPPWTLQRLVELLDNPRQIYSSTHKFMNSIEKLLSVTTTLDRFDS